MIPSIFYSNNYSISKEIQSVFFDNWLFFGFKTDFDDKIIINKNIIQDLRQKIYSLIFDSAEQFIQIRYVGLSDFYKKDIEQILFLTLNELSNFTNPEWCNIKSQSITDGIDAALCALVEIQKLNTFTREEMAEFIIKSAIYQINEK
jgi:hypothetical protein